LIKIAELNLEAIVQKKKEFIVRKQRGDSFIAYVMDSTQAFLNDCRDLSECIGISIISPGIIDSENGIIHYNAKLGLEDIPLKKIVEQKFGITTWLDNDVNALVLAEKNFG
jgi:N-acetylglucosamine repressor